MCVDKLDYNNTKIHGIKCIYKKNINFENVVYQPANFDIDDINSIYLYFFNLNLLD